jgi:hypothetical protein
LYAQLVTRYIDVRHKSNLMDVRSFRGANIDSNHFLVVSKLQARLANYKKECGTGARKYNVHKFNNDEISVQYKQKLNNKLNLIRHRNTQHKLTMACN